MLVCLAKMTGSLLSGRFLVPSIILLLLILKKNCISVFELFLFLLNFLKLCLIFLKIKIEFQIVLFYCVPDVMFYSFSFLQETCICARRIQKCISELGDNKSNQTQTAHFSDRGLSRSRNLRIFQDDRKSEHFAYG